MLRSILDIALVVKEKLNSVNTKTIRNEFAINLGFLAFICIYLFSSFQLFHTVVVIVIKLLYTYCTQLKPFVFYYFKYIIVLFTV